MVEMKRKMMMIKMIMMKNNTKNCIFFSKPINRISLANK